MTTEATEDLTAGAVSAEARSVFEAAMNLSPRQRALRLYRLDQETSPFATPEIEAAWMEEIGRRVESYRRGESKMIPAGEVFRKLREKLGK